MEPLSSGCGQSAEKRTATRFLLASIIVTSIAGCVESTNPFYTDNDLVEENLLVGRWENDWGLIKSSEGKTYIRTGKNPDEQGSSGNLPGKSIMTEHFWLMKLGDHYFIDRKSPKGRHQILRVAIFGDRMYLWSLNELWLNDELRVSPNMLAHKMEMLPGRDQREVLITATTADLQAFLLEHPDDAWGRCEAMIKKRGGIPVQPTGLASKKYRTFNYWHEVRRCVTLCQKLEIAELVSSRINDLEILGVDALAAECATEASATLAAVGQYTRRRKSAPRLLEAFIRGFAGDPLGVAQEQLAEDRQEEQQLRQRLARCAEKFAKARVVLTDRYEMEFPAVKW
jgi:hypothetical protein